MKILNPLTDRKAPVQQVLRDLASQEHCDGDPYDQMIEAAEHIDDLESEIMYLRKNLRERTDELNWVREVLGYKRVANEDY